MTAATAPATAGASASSRSSGWTRTSGALVLRRASADEIAAVAVSKGMKRLREDGLDKIRLGQTSPEEVLRVTASG